MTDATRASSVFVPRDYFTGVHAVMGSPQRSWKLHTFTLRVHLLAFLQLLECFGYLNVAVGVYWCSSVHVWAATVLRAVRVFIFCLVFETSFLLSVR